MLDCIDHVNLVVDDLERMATFYTSLLNMRITKRVTISGPWIDQTVGLTHVQADVIYLDPPSGPRVELIRYLRPESARPKALGESNTPGLRHLAFRVTGIEHLVGNLRRAGIQFLSDVQRVPTDQVSYGGDVQKHLVYFRDPEENLLELCEYKKRPSDGT
ncbi:MAG TPA: VOC family protein [Tepidisphaeraceae bacterium]|nr:VOC family protein [Tepidisphaeraceae bacterium]